MQYDLKFLPFSFGSTNMFTAMANNCSSLAVCTLKDNTKKTKHLIMLIYQN